jgi:hypothetical protein
VGVVMTNAEKLFENAMMSMELLDPYTENEIQKTE